MKHKFLIQSFKTSAFGWVWVEEGDVIIVKLFLVFLCSDISLKLINSSNT